MCVAISLKNLSCVVRTQIRAFRALGSWSDGAEQSVMVRFTTDEDTLRYVVSRMGRDAQQKYLYVADGTNNKVWILRRSDLEIIGEFGHFGWSGVLRGAAVMFFAYVGFDAVSTAAEETKNPQRNVPIGLIGSLLICTLFYLLVASGAIGAIGAQPQFGPDGLPLAPGSAETWAIWQWSRACRSTAHSTMTPGMSILSSVISLITFLVTFLL